MGSQGFTLTVSGSGFTAASVVYWGTGALTTRFDNASQLTAQVPVANIAASGVNSITVRTPASGAASSNVLQFEIDSATAGSTQAPAFGAVSATIAAGSTASYPVMLPSLATNISATCLNLPGGATCSYSAANEAVTISSQSTTPAGTYNVTVVFTETEPGTATAFVLLPIMLLPFAYPRKKTSSPSLLFTSLLGSLLLVMGAWVTACGGNSVSTQTPPIVSHLVTSSGIVNLTIQ